MEPLNYQVFNEINTLAQIDPQIIGFFLGGSRGKGIITKYSDYDMYIIVKDESLQRYREKFKFPPNSNHIFFKGNDLILFSLSQFKLHAQIGSESE